MDLNYRYPLKKNLAFVMFIGLILFCLCLGINASLVHQNSKYQVLYQDLKSQFLEQQNLPLLLGSGLATVGEAQVRLIILTRGDQWVAEIRQELPEGWEWQERASNDAGEQYHIFLGKVSVHSLLVERAVYRQYRKLVAAFRSPEVQIFLHEEIEESIDPAAYLSLIDVHPLQWANSYNVLSIAGFKEEIPVSVLTGPDRVNIQVLSRQNSTSSRTMLAIPVLLGEF